MGVINKFCICQYCGKNILEDEYYYSQNLHKEKYIKGDIVVAFAETVSCWCEKCYLQLHKEISEAKLCE